MEIKDHFFTKETFEIKETNIEGIWKTSPVPQNISKYYESTDYISHHQDSKNLKNIIYKFLQNYNLNYKKNILKSYIHQESRLLDYGCGAGEFLRKMEKECSVSGFEPNSIALEVARQKLPSIPFLSNLDNIEDNSLDIITLWHVFEHIENQQEMLKQFHQKLRADGKLIIAVPNPTSFDCLKYKEYWAAYDVPRHIFHFSKKGMLKLMNNKNWNIIKIKPLLLDAFYISSLSEKYKNSSLFWLKGLVFGAISNFKAAKTGEFSSLIYIIEKK